MADKYMLNYQTLVIFVLYFKQSSWLCQGGVKLRNRLSTILNEACVSNNKRLRILSSVSLRDQRIKEQENK